MAVRPSPGGKYSSKTPVMKSTIAEVPFLTSRGRESVVQ